MENNKNVLRYVACACFGICLLIELIDFVEYISDAFRNSYPSYQIMTLAFEIAAFALIIAAIITSKQILLVAGGAFGVFSTFIDTIFWLRNAYYYDYFPVRMFLQVIWLATWAIFILIGLKGKQYGKILGIIGGALVVISRIIIIVFNKLAYGGGHYSFQFYLYAIGFIGGVVLLGLTADSLPSAGSAAIGASGQYGAGAPNRQYRQYRRYDGSAPGGGPGPQNYQGPGGGPAPYNYQGPGGAGQQNYQAPGGGAAPYNYQGPGGGAGQQNYQGPGGGAAPYNYQGPGGAGQQNYQAPGGGAAPYNYQGFGGAGQQNYQAPGGGAAPYNYQGAGQQNYQAPGGWAPQNYQAPGGGAAPQNYQAPGGGEVPQNDSAPDGGSAPNDNSASDSVSPFFYNPGKSDEDAPL